MAKPVLLGGDPMQLQINLEWLLEVIKAVDRHSYGCGGLCTCVGGHNTMVDLTGKFVQMDVEELRKHCK